MFILDTHTLLWFLRYSSELSLSTKSMIQQADVVAVSINHKRYYHSQISSKNLLGIKKG